MNHFILLLLLCPLSVSISLKCNCVITNFIVILLYLGCLYPYICYACVYKFLHLLGYGDISPDTAWGQYTILLLMMIVALFVPSQLAKLRAMFKEEAATTLYTSGYGDWNHVIVCGDISVHQFTDFLREILHLDHGIQKLNVVLLKLNDNYVQYKKLLKKSTPFINRVTFLRGDPSKPEDLARAGIQTAIACFIFSSSHLYNVNNIKIRDNAVMAAINISNNNSRPPLFASTSSSEVATSLRWATCDVGGIVVSTEEIGDLITVRNVIAPGSSTFIANLCRSYTYIPPSPTVNADNSTPTWIDEYLSGLGNEIYPIVFSKAYAHKKYKDVCIDIFRSTGCILIGGLYSHNLELFPTKRVISEGDLGFLIADSALTAALASKGRPHDSNLLRNHKTGGVFAKNGINLVEIGLDTSIHGMGSKPESRRSMSRIKGIFDSKDTSTPSSKYSSQSVCSTSVYRT